MGGPIWMKFGFQIEFDLPKTVTSTSTKPEVVCSRRGRHLESHALGRTFNSNPDSGNPRLKNKIPHKRYS